MERTAPLLEAVRRDARGVAAARRRVWTRRALIAGFVCALMYVHYRTMHALAAFSTESFAEVSENRRGGEADASAARIEATHFDVERETDDRAECADGRGELWGLLRRGGGLGAFE